MDAFSKHRRKDASLAVIRSYQPVRIERELLAQAFEIVGRGADSLSERSADRQKRAVVTADSSAEHNLGTTVTVAKRDAQYDALEAVA